MVYLVSWALLKTTMHNVKNILTHWCHTNLYNSLQQSTPHPSPLVYKRTWVPLRSKDKPGSPYAKLCLITFNEHLRCL